MDIGKNLQTSLNLYSKNFGVLLGATLVAAILSGVTLGILAGPLLGGLMVLVLKLSRGENAGFNEIFHHFDQLGDTILIAVVLWAAVILNAILSAIFIAAPLIVWLVNVLLIGPVMAIICSLVIGLAVDQKKPAPDAFKQAFAIFKANLQPLWLYSLVFSLIGSVANIPYVSILAIFTAPVAVVGMTLAYQQLTTETPLSPPTDHVGPSM